MTNSTDEDAVCFARSQRIGILKSEGESLGSRGVCVGAESVAEDEVRAGSVTMEEVAVNRVCD